MMQWIYLGANDWTGTSRPTDYGDPDRPGGPHNTGELGQVMPGFDLSAEELAAVTRYVRETLSGGPDETEIVTEELGRPRPWTSADDGELIYKNAEPDARTGRRPPPPRAASDHPYTDEVSTDRHDVLVVGGGPAGAATAYWLAEAGHDVVVVEKKRFPREKTCGDGLTPRAVKQLADMGLADRLDGYHRYDGLRAVAHGITLELAVARAPRSTRPTATSCAGATSTRWSPSRR